MSARCEHDFGRPTDWTHRGWGVMARVAQCRRCDATMSETRATYLQDGVEHDFSRSAQVDDGR